MVCRQVAVGSNDLQQSSLEGAIQEGCADAVLLARLFWGAELCWLHMTVHMR